MKYPKTELGKRFAFTLAEVLITLGIIGVVAALTIPSLLKNYTKQVYVTSLKKAYSTLDEGFKLLLIDDGVEDITQTTLYQNLGSTVDFVSAEKELKRVFKIPQACQEGVGLCGKFKYGDNVSVNGPCAFGNTGCTSAFDFWLTDGTLIQIIRSNSTAGSDKALDVVVDINGPNKMPNLYGRDVFRLMFLKNKMVAWYDYSPVDEWETGTDGTPCTPLPDTDPHYVPDAEMTGMWDCAQRIIEQGWQMNY